MSTQILVEFSPNGILGRILDGDSIVYPGVFLGLPFDVHMPRGTPVYGPDVTFDTRFGTPCGTMKATLPELTPATESAPRRAFPRIDTPRLDAPTPSAPPDTGRVILWTDNHGNYSRDFTPSCTTSVLTDPESAALFLNAKQDVTK